MLNRFPLENGDDGDGMLWAGMLCLVGVTRYNDTIRACQSLSGRTWRSPSRVDNDPNCSFSRDMANGLIAYVSTSGDTAWGQKWIDYVVNNTCLACSPCNDNRCLMTPAVFWLASYSGLQVPWYYRATRFLLDGFLAIQACLAPKGYQAHLTGVTAFIRSVQKGKRSKLTGKILAYRDNYNPFYLWLSGNDTQALKVHNEIKAKIPANCPANQWYTQRDSSEQAWLTAMPECIEFLDLMFNSKLS